MAALLKSAEDRLEQEKTRSCLAEADVAHWIRERDEVAKAADEMASVLEHLQGVQACNERDWKDAYLTGKVEAERLLRVTTDKAVQLDERCREASAISLELVATIDSLKVLSQCYCLCR